METIWKKKHSQVYYQCKYGKVWSEKEIGHCRYWYARLQHTGFVFEFSNRQYAQDFLISYYRIDTEIENTRDKIIRKTLNQLRKNGVDSLFCGRR